MKLFTRPASLAVAALSILLWPLGAAAQTVEIKPRWVVGKKYFQTIKTLQETSFAVGPEKMEQTMSMTMDLSVAVRAHEDGQRKRLTLRYDRVAVAMRMNDQQMDYDSAKADGGDPMGFGKTMGATVGKELVMLADARDEIVEIENYEEFIKQLDSPSIPGMDPRQLYSRGALTQMMKQGALLAVPPKAVQPGASWPFVNEIVLPQVGKLSIRGSYTFKGMVDHQGFSCAEIGAEAALTMDLGGSADAADPTAQVQTKMTDGALTGTVWFDPELGQVRATELVQRMTLTMKNPDDAGAPLTMPMKQHISTTMTKVEDLK